MADPKNVSAGSEPPPTPGLTSRNPRRTSPENSITLRHHRLGRELNRRYTPANIPNAQGKMKHSRRQSSGESHGTGVSDPKKWFDSSNRNDATDLDTSAMDVDVDPPFYQKETESSNGETKYGIPSQSPAYRYVQSRAPALRPGITHSSSADDYRSVIDDLTVENKRLKEELKKFKQMGPDSLRRDKLFEVKVHGLPSRRKRELEAALRDFATSVDESSAGDSPSHRKLSSKNNNVHSTASKHASSTSTGSNSRPVDSAYASMSGPGSSILSLPGYAKAPPSKLARQRSNQNIENYLRDIPEGLWPRPAIMTEKEKKKLCVKRLEQLFTGKMPATNLSPSPRPQVPPEPIAEDTEMEENPYGQCLPIPAASREAKIRPRGELRRKSSHPRENSSSNTNTQSQEFSNQEHSNGDQTMDSRSGSGSGDRGGNAISPQRATTPPEQRPTRPRDLDPDRKQVPADNMDYMRHLGMVAPEGRQRYSAKDVSPDADGWVYLNLLCNMAQLHIFNVTPDFIRSAVSEKSTKFQLSPDGRKIRWRGGNEGTRFSSDNSSGSSSQRQSSDDTDGSNDQDQRKRQKTGTDVTGQRTSKFGLGVQDSNSTESFHYKPLFVHQQTASSSEEPSLGEVTSSSYGPPEESNPGRTSRWGQSGVSMGGMPQSQRKRRRDGAIIYYSGAPFCTDLSGDYGEVSPDAYDMTSYGDQDPVSLDITEPPQLSRTTSGSSIPFKPLSGPESHNSIKDLDADRLTPAENEDDIEADFPWADDVDQECHLVNLEASGLGGVSPDDHFVMVVTTGRPKRASSDGDSSDDGNSPSDRPRALVRLSHDTVESRGSTDTIAGKLASMTTASPIPLCAPSNKGRVVEIEYRQGKMRRLPPVPLPPPAFYFPSCDSELDSDDESTDDLELSSADLVSRRAKLDDGPFANNDDLSGNDEEDELSDEDRKYDTSDSVSPVVNMRSDDDINHSGDELSKMTTGSSVATAGGAASGYNSSMEDA
ncbi:frequency clock protein [Xylariomycetidae sp. FL0641]|nr:frequency clock protein [Xylariomycetidae sp. FL0641]